MFVRTKALLSLPTCCLTLIFAFAVKAQQPGPTPSSKPSSNEISRDDLTTQTDELDLWHRETLTDDWSGTRTRWKEHGVEMKFTVTGFVQGTASGGIRRQTEGNGKFESEFNFDFEKLVGWKHWTGEAKVEYRFGGPVLTGSGSINTVNTDVTVPASQGSVAAITALNFTRSFPMNSKKDQQIDVSFGRYNTLDIQEKFFGGAGLEKFFNVAHIGPMTGLRQVPNVTNGAGIDYIRDGESFLAFGILDPVDHSTNVGLDELFSNGITLAPVINLPTKWFGKNGKHSFSYTVTTKAYTPFDALKQIILPGPSLNPVQPKRGSFSLSYVGRQFVVQRGKDDGWGVFTQVSIADKNTSPVTHFVDVGIGGNGVFTKRVQDEFGIAYAYTGLSKVLTENLNLVTLGSVRPHAEHQLEGFYNIHVTPWLRLTADIQIIRPVVLRAATAVIPGARLELIF